MNFQNFRSSFFYTHDLVIFLYIVGLYAFITIGIVLLVYAPRLSGFFSSFNGIHGTFYSPAATMFALISAFMGATLVGGFNAHTESINRERTALLLYVDFVNFPLNWLLKTYNTKSKIICSQA